MPLSQPSSVVLALIVAVAPAATISALGRRLDGTTRKLLAFGRDVVPLVPSSLIEPDEKMIAANGLAILAALPYIVFTAVAQFFLVQQVMLPIGLGTVMGAFAAWPLGYSRARRVAEDRS